MLVSLLGFQAQVQGQGNFTLLQATLFLQAGYV
jgi:hypothetical protein